MSKPRPEVITFKVDEALSNAMKGIENRSEFIRSALLSALDSTCPLCKGAGVLTPLQKAHWKDFARDHTVLRCHECQALHLRCDAGG